MKLESCVLSVLLMGFLAGTTLGEEEHRVVSVVTPLVAKECGACHLAFPAEFLPERSWRKLLGGLAEHFGEDASLSATQTNEILAYYVANAGDRTRSTRLKNLSNRETPLRITELPQWRHEHEEEVDQNVWKLPSVKSRANCAACHLDASKGDYSERSVRIPKG